MERWKRGQSESKIGGEKKRNGRLVGAAKTSKELAEWRRLQRKNLSILGLLKRKGWPQCHRESSCQVRQSRLCQKGKEQSRLSRVPDRKEDIQCQRSKENSSKEKKKRRVFLCRKTVRVKVKNKVILTSFSKNSRKRDICWGERPKKEGQLVKLVGDQNTDSEAPPRSKKGQREKNKGRSNCQRSDEEELVCQSY